MAVVSKKYRLAYFPIPKVACSSLKHAMFRLEHGTDFPGGSGRSIHQVYASAPLRRRTFKDLEGVYKFAVVRDPVSRILATYTNKIISGDALAGLEKSLRTRLANRLVGLTGLDAERYRSLPTRPDLDTFALNLDLYCQKYPLIYSHTRLSSYYLGEDLSRFDAIYPISALPKLEQDIRSRAGAEFTIPARNVTAPSNRVSVSDMSRESFEALMTYLQPDYRLLADFLERPKYPEPLLTE